MATIILNGTEQPIPALLYGAVRKNKDVIDAFTADGLTISQRTEASIPLLRLAFPDAAEDAFDALSPGSIQLAALQVYKATFERPEADAPVPPTNP